MKLKAFFADEKKRIILTLILSGPALVLSLGGWLKGILPFDWSWIAIVLCGIPIIIGAAEALIRDHNIKADFLVSLALIASIWIREYFAAGEVAFIMQVGTLLEDLTADKARQGIAALIRLTPQTARVRRNQKEIIIPADEVAAGDILIVLAGEAIPADGTILSGETSVDQSTMTGESIPVDKKAGDEVISGTINQFGTFEMRASKTCRDSSLQRMIRLAQEADANKAPIVGLADKWATWMVVAALILSVLTGLISGKIIRAVTVLVVFCPCAFILATPTAIMAGIGNAARYGILIRSGDALERLSQIVRIAFDKTGTLTCGKPKVTATVSLSDSFSGDEILRLTAEAEQRSEHPLGKAIREAVLSQGKSSEDISDFQMTPGKGVKANAEGHLVMSGKADWLADNGVEISEEAVQKAGQYSRQGAAIVFTAIDGRLSGLIALADTVRPEAKVSIERLKAAGITPLLLTGDNEAAARSIAAQVGIDEVKANLMPENKMDIIRELGLRNEPVCMVGDGVNDALALSTARAGIAMGGIGSDIAVDSSDAVLVKDDLSQLPYLFDITKKTMKKIRQNILISLGINILAVTLSILGLLNPVTGALMHNCGSVFVVINAALLLRVKNRN